MLTNHELNGDVPTPDAQETGIRDRVEGMLWRHPYLALRRISCDFHDGTLVLRGCLPSYYLKQIAQATVTEMEGVDRVENQIEVVTCGRP